MRVSLFKARGYLNYKFSGLFKDQSLNIFAEAIDYFKVRGFPNSRVFLE